MAIVYRARDLKHDRQVAIKVFKPELANVLGPDRFLREIKVTAQLSHPHILPLLDSGEADGLLFYVMPFVEGDRCVTGWDATASCRSTKRCASRAKSPTRSSRRTAVASSIAT